LLYPWLREQESVLVYSATGVGKSLFALSCAIAIAGNGQFLGWRPQPRPNGKNYRVLYVDGEQHIGDIQERARMLLGATPEVDRESALRNLVFLPRQYQKPGMPFPLITDPDGAEFVLQYVKDQGIDLILLDNFSTLGEVENENAASSFNDVQETLLGLKTAGVATMLVHHSNKSGVDFRGSSKIAATFETIIQLERPDGKLWTGETAPDTGEARFTLRWKKNRAGGPKRRVREIVARLTEVLFSEDSGVGGVVWEYEEQELGRLETIKERLTKGEFAYKKEIGDAFGVTKQRAGQYIENGIRIGLWTDGWVKDRLSYGKNLRRLDKTQAPLRPSLFTEDDEHDEVEDTHAEEETFNGPDSDF
jgi:hypothetical protein